MGNAMVDIADSTGCSLVGAKLAVSCQIIEIVCGTDLNTAMTSSVTTYYGSFIAPCPMTLIDAYARAAAAGVASSTLDLQKVPSGTSIAAGTGMITQIAGTALTANTNIKATLSSTILNRNVNAGDMVIVKIVTQAGETLKPPVVTAIFKV